MSKDTEEVNRRANNLRVNYGLSDAQRIARQGLIDELLCEVEESGPLTGWRIRNIIRILRLMNP